MRKKLFSITKKDLEVQTFRSGGKGGQHQNKTDSGVRIIHRESGAIGESRTERSQYQNKKLALQRLTKDPKFKIWVSKKSFELRNNRTLEQMIEETISKENLKIEIKDDKGKWKTLKKI